jgi:hypothetical protein
MNVTFNNTELTAGTVDGRNFTISAAGKIWVNRARPSKAAEADIRNAIASAKLVEMTQKAAPVDADVKLVVLVKANPKREGCAAYERFSAYFSKKVKTVGDALEAGLTRKDIAWDTNHGYIQLAA